MSASGVGRSRNGWAFGVRLSLDSSLGLTVVRGQQLRTVVLLRCGSRVRDWMNIPECYVLPDGDVVGYTD